MQKAAKATVVKPVNQSKNLNRRAIGKSGEKNTGVSFEVSKGREVGTAAPTKDKGDSRETKKINGMLHLSIKRFDDNDPTLTAGAKRNRLQHPYVAIVERDPSGRSACKHCGVVIQPKGVIRISLMMECHKGYRNPCTLHESCFWKHREFEKINTAEEISIHRSIIEDDPTFKNKFAETFVAMKIKVKSNENLILETK